MVVVLDPPAAETSSPRKKRGGGPKTHAGRLRSRENSLSESIRSKVLFSRDMAARILERNALLNAQFHPKTRYELMLIADMALAKARIDRTKELQVENENRYIGRTLDYWDYDQRSRALDLRARISKDPARIQHALSGFKQGTELLISEWVGLASALEVGDWDQTQRDLCLDLLGVRPELRVGNSLCPPTVDRASRAAFTARQIARLEERKETWLDEHDEEFQIDALSGLAPEDDATTKRLRRYENMSNRDYQKAFDELMRVKAEGEARFEETGIRTSLRPWDVDSLIERLRAIQNPPDLVDEVEAAMPPTRQPDESSPRAAANAPDASGVAKAPQTVAPAATTPSTVETTVTAGGDECRAESETAAAIATASSAPLPGPVILLPKSFPDTIPTPPASRRARKELQKRLRDAARKEGKKGR